MLQFQSNELHSQMQIRDISEKTWEISETSRGDVFNTSHRRRLRDLQISPLSDVSETLHETSQRCIWDASMPARTVLLIKRLQRRCFPVNFAKFSKTHFIQNTSGRLLLILQTLKGYFIWRLSIDLSKMVLHTTDATLSKKRKVYRFKEGAMS